MNWSYIAGFFDGEGTIDPCENNRYKVGITQANKKVLKEIQLFTKIGYIHYIKKRKSHWKDAWFYYISKQEDVYKFLNKISPFLVVKRKEVLKIIPELKEKVAQMEEQKLKSIKRKRLAKKLRKKGLSYREIGKQVGIDWGYARRLILDLEGPKI